MLCYKFGIEYLRYRLSSHLLGMIHIGLLMLYLWSLYNMGLCKFGILGMMSKFGSLLLLMYRDNIVGQPDLRNIHLQHHRQNTD